MFSSLVVDLANKCRRRLHRQGPPGGVGFSSPARRLPRRTTRCRGSTLFIPSASANSFLVFDVFREIARFGGDVLAMAPLLAAKCGRRSTDRERLRGRPRRTGRPERRADANAVPRSGDRGDPPPDPRDRRGAAGAVVGVVDDLEGRGARADRRGPRTAPRGAASGARAARRSARSTSPVCATKATRSSTRPAPAPSAWWRGRRWSRRLRPWATRSWTPPRPRPDWPHRPRSRTSATRSWRASRSSSSAP